MNQIKNNSFTSSADFQHATGAIPYNMTNDYMFRAVLQKNNKVLKGLICALLHLNETDVISVTIMNPIILGDALEDKEFRLDINVLLNNNTYINLEMQVANKLNWQNRSISYLCRTYDQLHHGQDYSEAKAVIHIGFLDYTLFPDSPEFYSTYKLMNVNNHRIYSDNLILRVLDLTQINLATSEDKAYLIDYWAALFKAKTWEEIKMLAEKNEYLNEASETMFQLSADELIKKRCRDREEYYQDLRNYERVIAEMKNTIKDKDTAIANITAEKEASLSQLEKLTSEMEKLRAENEALKRQQ